jgi:G3E family GTPase
MAPPITVITGFLGSGKTTLLRHVLEHGLAGRRVALIVNEIGEVGFDGQVIGGTSAADMVELTSGCICCSVGTDFLLALEEIMELAAPDLIIVETTGLAEPWGIIRQVRASGLPLDAVVTLVDAANIGRALELSPVAGWQIRAADFLVLNKCDLATPAKLDALRALLREQNERAAIFTTVRGALDAGILFAPPVSAAGTGAFSPPAAAPAVSEGTSAHLDQDRITTLLWQGAAPLERARLEAALGALPPEIYRAKGLVHCTDAPWPSPVHIVCGRVDYETTRLKSPPAHLNQLVFIGRRLAPLRDELFARLDACADTPERAAAWQARQGA